MRPSEFIEKAVIQMMGAVASGELELDTAIETARQAAEKTYNDIHLIKDFDFVFLQDELGMCYSSIKKALDEHNTGQDWRTIKGHLQDALRDIEHIHFLSIEKAPNLDEEECEP